MNLEPPFPGAVRIASGGSGARGNLLWLQDADPRRVLKIYRPRSSRSIEAVFEPLTRWFQGVTGTRADVRYRNELEGLRIWKDHGFDVVGLLDEPIPATVREPALWLEYIEAPTLKQVLSDSTIDWKERQGWIERYARAIGERHHVAQAEGELRLIHEHGGAIHVFALPERLVFFDLEGAYRPGLRLEEAMAQEVSSALRSIAKSIPDRVESSLRVFQQGYGRAELLDRVVRWGAEGRSWLRYAKRISASRRGEFSKRKMLQRLLLEMAS